MKWLSLKNICQLVANLMVAFMYQNQCCLSAVLIPLVIEIAVNSRDVCYHEHILFGMDCILLVLLTYKRLSVYGTNIAYCSAPVNKAQLYSPSSQYITGGKIDYNSFSNMNGTVNTTTPFEALPYTGINFETVTQSLRNKRFVEVFWPNNTAFLDSEYTYKTKDINTHIVGAVLIELPITTRHIGKMDYEYKEGPQHTTGLATVEYNKAKFLEGKYSCESQSTKGFKKDIINIEIENGFSPIGINYVHDLSYNAGSEGSNLPTIDKKHAQLFNLHNITIFNLTGEVLVKTTETGKDITLTGTHTNRTVTLKTNYDFLDHEFRQKSHWELAPHVWATYNVVINNKTTYLQLSRRIISVYVGRALLSSVDTDKEKREQHIELDMAYPRRDFSMKGYYQILNKSLSSEIAIMWDKQNVTKKSIGASIDWKRISLYPNKQHAVLSIKHPSFKRGSEISLIEKHLNTPNKNTNHGLSVTSKQDVTFNANYLSGDKEFVDVASEVVYSTENNKKLRLSGKLLDNSQSLFKQYDYELLGNHPATRLDLKVFGDLHAGNGLYKSNNVAQYKRTYLPLQKGESNAFLNTVMKEIEIEKITQREHSFLKGKYEGKSPLYTITGAVRNGTSDLDSTSILFINIEEKLIVGTVNFTPDASESFHMYGIIPDARNAKFNAWRNYEDDSISDISYYLRLNHSHLVTSKLIWRPEIEYEVKASTSKEIESEIEIETQCNDDHLLKQRSEDCSEDLINTNADDSNTTKITDHSDKCYVTDTIQEVNNSCDKLKDPVNWPKVLSAIELSPNVSHVPTGWRGAGTTYGARYITAGCQFIIHFI
ncbi:unnamed protein product [Timema podura]|uniref:Uncharacterized protein n=1 Tax=Timema podura TaxID=61482 RepID=A0ABN7NFD3_TIMPD|nr:unnamed protein product [Timema podura]